MEEQQPAAVVGKVVREVPADDRFMGKICGDIRKITIAGDSRR